MAENSTAYDKRAAAQADMHRPGVTYEERSKAQKRMHEQQAK
jgi:hypothetical protein